MKTKGSKHILIAAKKGNLLQYGTAPKIANLVGVTSQTVLRWAKKEDVRIENGYELIFNMEKL